MKKMNLKSKIKELLRKSILLYKVNIRLNALFAPQFWDNIKFIRNNCCDSTIYTSQFGQDWFVYNYFKQQKGTFLDVGANHPTFISNTYALEQNGWTGLAFEPQEHLYKLWKSMRTVECLPYACGKENKKVQFRVCEGDTSSGVASHVEKPGKIIEVQQVRIGDILKEKNISHIDYMSVDVEGYEYDVLEGIDFESVDIELIGLENNKGGDKGEQELREYMRKKGYRYIARIEIDDFFAKI